MGFGTSYRQAGIETVVWVSGWERPPCKAFGRAISPDRPSTLTLTIIDDSFGQVSRALGRGDSGPAYFDVVVQVLSRQFDHGGVASALSKLQNVGVLNGSSYAAYYRAVRVVNSGVTGIESTLASGVGLVLETVRLSVNEKPPQLMPSLYPGELATCPLPFGSIDYMWLTLGALANSKTPALNDKKYLITACFGIGGACISPSGPSPVALGRGQGCAPSQTSAWATGWQRNTVIVSVCHKVLDLAASPL